MSSTTPMPEKIPEQIPNIEIEIKQKYGAEAPIGSTAATDLAATALAQKAIAERAVEKELSHILATVKETVHPKETLSEFTSFLTAITKDLETKKPKNYQAVISKIQLIQDRLHKELSGPGVPEIVVRKLIAARDEIVNLFIENLSAEELLSLEIPNIVSNAPPIVDYLTKSQPKPSPLFDLFNNFKCRLLLKKEAESADPKELEVFVNSSLNGGLVDLAQEFLESLPIEAQYSNFLKIVKHCTHSMATYDELIRGIALTMEHPYFLSRELQSRIEDLSQYNPEYALKANKDAFYSLRPSIQNFVKLTIELEQFANEGANLAIMRKHIGKIIAAATEAYPEGIRGLLFLELGDTLLGLGLYRELTKLLEPIKYVLPHQQKEVEHLYGRLCDKLLESGEIPLIYEFLDKLPLDTLPKRLADIAIALNNNDDIAGLQELLEYAVRRGTDIDLLAQIHELNFNEHFKLIVALSYYGADPQAFPQEDKEATDLAKFARIAFLRQYQKFILREVPVGAGSEEFPKMGSADEARLMISYLDLKEQLNAENFIELGRMCFAADPQLTGLKAKLQEKAEEAEIEEFEGDVPEVE